MNVRTGIIAILVCTILFATIGTGIGALIGVCAPDYYRTVFAGGPNRDFDPIQVGIGLGMTQGVAGGAIIGVLLVLILAWRETRLQRLSKTIPDDDYQGVFGR